MSVVKLGFFGGLVHLGVREGKGADGCGGERENGRERQGGGVKECVVCEVSAGVGGGFGVAGSGDLGEGCGSFVV